MKIIFYFILMGLFASALGCVRAPSGGSSRPKQTPESPILVTPPPAVENNGRDKEGGQDIGGGDPVLSSEAEVRTALNRVLEMLVPKPGLQGWISMIPEDLKNSNHKDYELVKKVFYHKLPGSDEEIKIHDYLKQSKIEIIDKGLCKGPNGGHVAAAVSSHKIGAEICISIERLRRISKAILFNEIYCLMLHEAAHLVGMSEDQAIAVQKASYEVLDKVDKIYPKEVVVKILSEGISSVRKNLIRAEKLLLANPHDPQIGFLVGKSLADLKWRMPFSNSAISGSTVLFLFGDKLFPVYLFLAHVWSPLYIHFSGVDLKSAEARQDYFDETGMHLAEDADFIESTSGFSNVPVTSKAQALEHALAILKFSEEKVEEMAKEIAKESKAVQ